MALLGAVTCPVSPSTGPVKLLPVPLALKEMPVPVCPPLNEKVSLSSTVAMDPLATHPGVT